MPPQGDVGECPCFVHGDAYGKENVKPQKIFPGWETSGLPGSCVLLKNTQTCIIYDDLRGFILRHMVVNQAFTRWGS